MLARIFCFSIKGAEACQPASNYLCCVSLIVLNSFTFCVIFTFLFHSYFLKCFSSIPMEEIDNFYFYFYHFYPYNHSSNFFYYCNEKAQFKKGYTWGCRLNVPASSDLVSLRRQQEATIFLWDSWPTGHLVWGPDEVRTNHETMKWTNSSLVFYKVTCHFYIYSRWQVTEEEFCTLTLYGLTFKFILRLNLYSTIRKTQLKNEVLMIGNTFVTDRWSWSLNSSLMRWYHMIAIYFTITSNNCPKYFATTVFIQ